MRSWISDGQHVRPVVLPTSGGDRAAKTVGDRPQWQRCEELVIWGLDKPRGIAAISNRLIYVWAWRTKAVAVRS